MFSLQNLRKFCFFSCNNIVTLLEFKCIISLLICLQVMQTLSFSVSHSEAYQGSIKLLTIFYC